MKARTADDVIRRLSDKETDALYKYCFDNALQSIVAGLLYVFYLRGWRKKRLRRLFESFVELYSLPPVFGKRLTDTDTIAFVSHKAGITENDWQRLKDSAQIDVKG